MKKRDDYEQQPSSFDDIITIAGELQEELNELKYQRHKLPEFISRLRERAEWLRKTEQNVRNEPTQSQYYTPIQKLILSILNDLVASELEAYERIFELEAENESLKEKHKSVS